MQKPASPTEKRVSAFVLEITPARERPPARIRASAAFDALVGVDNVLAVALGNSFNGIRKRKRRS
jgi:hypothetical protein